MSTLDDAPERANRPVFPTEFVTVREELSEIFERTPLYRELGIHIDAWGPGWAHVHLDARPELANLAGSLHGGVSFSLADAAFEIACNSYGRMSVALEVSCHHHRPAPTSGKVVADCWEITRGGRTASYRIQVSDADGVLLSSYLALAYRTKHWHVERSRLPVDWN